MLRMNSLIVIPGQWLDDYRRGRSRAPARQGKGREGKGIKERRTDQQKNEKVYKKPMESFYQSASSRRIRDASAMNLCPDKPVYPVPTPPAYGALSSGPTTDLSYFSHFLNSRQPRFSWSCAKRLFELLFYSSASELYTSLLPLPDPNSPQPRGLE